MPEAKTASPRTRSTSAKRSTTAKRAGATARRAVSASTQASRANPAERIVLVPLGAALLARERVLAGVNDALDHYSTPSKASAQLRRFERRGATARKRLEREVRKTRVRVERELRQSRTRVEHELRRRRRAGEELADRVQERLLGRF